MQWIVAGLVVLVAGVAAIGTAAFLAIPMVDYSLTWWKLVLGW